MTLQEVCKILGKSEITLTNAFQRTRLNLKKKGIILLKTGRGTKADYDIIYEERSEINEK